MLTSTHRWIYDPALAFLPTQATTGGIDFTRYFANRSWVLEANGVVSHVDGRPRGDPGASRRTRSTTTSGRTRPTSGSTRTPDVALRPRRARCASAAPSSSRLRLLDHFHWYSPGLDLNDVGYLRQADVIAQPGVPRLVGADAEGPLPQLLAPALARGPVGLRRARTRARATALEASGHVPRTSGRPRRSLGLPGRGGHAAAARRPRPALARLLRGVPRARSSDTSRRVSASALRRARLGARRRLARTRAWARGLNLRLSNRLSLSGSAYYEQLLDNLQYVATADADDGDPRWVLGRIDQDTWNFTFRVNLSITPDLTVQYYGSPFIGTGRYTAFKRATDTLATRLRGPLPPLRPGRDRVSRRRTTPTG